MTLGQFTGLNPGIFPSKSAQRRRARSLRPSAGSRAGRERWGPAWPRRAQHTRRGASSGWPEAAPLPPACWPPLCKVRGPELAVEILGWALGPSPDLSLCSRHGATQSGLGRAPLPNAQRPLHRAYPPRSPEERGQREDPKAVSEPTLRARRTLDSPGFRREGLGEAQGQQPAAGVGEGKGRPGIRRGLSGGRG